MKRYQTVLLVLLAVILTACGAAEQSALYDMAMNVRQTQTTGQESSMEEVPLPVYETPVYAFDVTERSNRYVREDTGEESAVYRYSLPQMKVVNENALSPLDRNTAQRNVDAFNTWMQERMAEFIVYGEEMLESQQELVESEETVSFVAVDEILCRTEQHGEIVTVLAQCYNDGGGAHPNTYTISYTFDLSIAQFIDPTQIADDPEKFRTLAAELLIQHAEALDEEYTSGFWADYRDSIARWNEAAVTFSEKGMTVTFSAYTLGPYAMGQVALTLSYQELTEALGTGGLTHLGISENGNT